MKVLVTGANGFLGQHVVGTLLADGHDVVAVQRSLGDAGHPDHPGLEVRQSDLRVDDVATLLPGVDVVVHLAAQVTGSDEARFGSTVVGTERLLEALPRSGVSRLVLVSSYSVYDWERTAGTLDESSPTLRRPYGRDGYAVAKVWQERIVQEFGDTSSTEVTVLRPGFIWGPGREDLAGAGIRLGPLLLVVGPRMRLPLTFVGNCAEAVARAVTSPRAAGQTLNVVDGRGVAAWRYSRLLARLDTGLRWRVPVPYRPAAAFVSLVSGMMPRIFHDGGKLPGVLVPASFAARFRPLEHGAGKAAEVLGWRPRVDFREAERLALAASREL